MSNDWDVWNADDPAVQRINEQAIDIFAEDRMESLRLFREAAAQGSVWAMREAGSALRQGQGAPRDIDAAQGYLEMAVAGGSQTASLVLAKLLFHEREGDNWKRPLEKAFAEGFSPAAFWHAWFSYKRSRRFRAARENRALMEVAANAGHPGARIMLSRWKAKGALGLGEIRSGFREMRALIHDFTRGDLAPYRDRTAE